jgi:hypothetical protein
MHKRAKTAFFCHFSPVYGVFLRWMRSGVLRQLVGVLRVLGELGDL